MSFDNATDDWRVQRTRTFRLQLSSKELLDLKQAAMDVGLDAGSFARAAIAKRVIEVNQAVVNELEKIDRPLHPEFRG